MISFNLFAASIETPTVQADHLFNIGPFSIQNSTLLGWIGVILTIYALVWVARSTGLRPSKNKFANLIELFCEYIINLMEEVMNSRKKALRYAPLILTLFFVILINNWLGLVPGVGHSITLSTAEGHVPFLRSFSSDINNTLALAIATIILVQIYSIRTLGGWGYFKHFFTDKPYNPINLFIGLIEVLSEFTKVISLSFRLFGNVFAGEVLLFVMGAISGWMAPVVTLPFMFMELFAGFLQAFVFAILAVVYISISTSGHSEHEKSHESIADQLPDNKLIQAVD